MNCKVCQIETNFPNGLCANCHNCGLVGINSEGLIFDPNKLKYFVIGGGFGPVLSDHIFNLIQSLNNKVSTQLNIFYPETVDVDGINDPSGRITYFGKATRVRDNIYQCLARVDSSLCRVEVSIKFSERSSSEVTFITNSKI